MAAHAHTEFLRPFPADEVRVPLGNVEVALYNLQVLIETIADAADSASLHAKERSIDATKKVLDRIVCLASITLEERQRAQDAFYQGDDVLTAHIVERIAA